MLWYTEQDFGPNHFAQITFGQFDDLPVITRLLGRHGNQGNAYGAVFHKNFTYLYRIISGDYLNHSTTTIRFGTGDVGPLEVVGGNLRLLRNDVLFLSRKDANLITGIPGFLIQQSNVGFTREIASFSCGDST